MPSKKIYDKRHERRFKVEEDKKKELKDKFDDITKIIDINNLIRGLEASKKNVSWKPSIQQYEINMFRNFILMIEKFMDLYDENINFYKFIISERGKIREIQSVSISERVFQHVLCDEILYPYIVNSLIYDNAASLKGKGTSFSINRIATHLSKFYRRNGNSNAGYILLIDFSSFFARISHPILEETINKLFDSKELRVAIMRIINSFGEVGLGLGCQVCQILALHYLNGIDHYIKEKLHVHYNGRYMDDSYFILNTYEECEEILNKLLPIYEKMNIKVNMKKTKIISLKESDFKFLQKRFRLTETGKVVIKENSSSGKRLNNKMKKLRKLYEDTEIDLKYVIQLYKSWEGTNKKCNSKKYIEKIKKSVIDKFPGCEDRL